MMLAALAFVLFEKLVRQPDPFTSAERTLKRPMTQEGDWRRYEGDDFCVELGPYADRKPQKILISSRFASRDAAIAHAKELLAAFPIPPQPRPPLVVDGPFSYRGTLVIARKPVGVEIDLAEADNAWRVIAKLIAGGPRIVVPLSSIHAPPRPPLPRDAGRGHPSRTG